jgi:hypothetical protein
MSDPGHHQAVLAVLPSEISALNSIIQGLLLHCDWLPDYGLDANHHSVASRQTLPIADRLTGIVARDNRPLRTPRSADQRAVGTCRDFALMLCSILRCKGIPARVRCGFAAYFGTGWEDHWVCEYWDDAACTWRLSDPQLDGIVRSKCRIDFDPTNVPRDLFVTAGQAWSDCRAGRSDPDRFGKSDFAGLWFVRLNVVRDHHALNGREVSIWDSWRAASPATRVVSDHEIVWLDDLAERPDQALAEVDPEWLANRLAQP